MCGCGCGRRFVSPSAATRQLDEPHFYRFEHYATSNDRSLYLRLDGWERGYVWINGRLLSRYWTIGGPQLTVHVPAIYLRTGNNEIVLLELSGVSDFTIVFAAVPDLGPPAPIPEW